MVNWDAEKDRIILKGIFQFHDIKNSQRLLDYLAVEIGDGCTPKAVSHRLSNLRNTGKMTAGGSPKKTPAMPRSPSTPASARGGRVSKVASGKKKVKNDNNNGTISGDDSNEDDPIVSPSAGRKRARVSKTLKSYAESDATSGDEEEPFTPVNKKVKKEVVEDEVCDGTITQAPVEAEEELAFI